MLWNTFRKWLIGDMGTPGDYMYQPIHLITLAVVIAVFKVLQGHGIAFAAYRYGVCAVAAVDFRVNYFDNMIGAEVMGLYQIEDRAFVEKLVKDIFERRKEIYHGRKM